MDDKAWTSQQRKLRSRQQIFGRGVLAVLLTSLVLAECYHCVFRCDHDFRWHYSFGKDFLQDRLYVVKGLHYLPARGMFDALTACLPYRLARAIWLVGNIAGLVYTIRAWASFAPRPRKGRLLPTLVVLAVAGSYIHRDLVECGLQLFLLSLLTLALVALRRGCAAQCGCWLGVAAMYKVMPVLFLPYLLWKREWRASGWMAAVICLLCLLPALRLGWENNLQLHRQWLSSAARRLALEDPSENGVETPTLRNRSLPLALARLVQTYPAGHPLHVDTRGFVSFASLTPHAAKRFVQFSLLALSLTLAWCFRRSLEVSSSAGRATLAAEWSVVCILVAVLSPLCWLHHLVLAIPAALLFTYDMAERGARPWEWCLGALSALAVVLVHRGLLSETTWNAVSVGHPHTLAMLVCGGLVLSRTLRPSAMASGKIPANWVIGAATT